MKNKKEKNTLSILLIIIDVLALFTFFIVYGPFDTFRNWFIPTSMTTMTHRYFAHTLYDDETIQNYLDDQGGITCKEGNFKIPNELEGMREYIEAGKVADFHDHHYPSEMSVDALIQTFLMDESDEAVETFLKRFDSEWERYNRDLIRKVKEYYKEEHNEE